MATTELWTTPGPSSGFLESATLKTLAGRTCVLNFGAESASGDCQQYELRFYEVVAYKCTYLPGLSVEMLRSAYDKVIDVGMTSWLAETNALSANALEGAVLRHLRVCFDDGPCYEFLCRRFDATPA